MRPVFKITLEREEEMGDGCLDPGGILDRAAQGIIDLFPSYQLPASVQLQGGNGTAGTAVVLVDESVLYDRATICAAALKLGVLVSALNRGTARLKAALAPCFFFGCVSGEFEIEARPDSERFALQLKAAAAQHEVKITGEVVGSPIGSPPVQYILYWTEGAVENFLRWGSLLGSSPLIRRISCLSFQIRDKIGASSFQGAPLWVSKNRI